MDTIIAAHGLTKCFGGKIVVNRLDLSVPQGAIFALLGVLILFARRLGFSPTWLIVIGIVNLAYGFVAAGISWQGHLGGLVSGLLLGALFIYTQPQRRRSLQIAGLIGLPTLFILAIFLYAP